MSPALPSELTKAIPGASPDLLEQLGLLADRVSVNIEQCTAASLSLLAPQKTAAAIARPMQYLSERRQNNRDELVRYRHAPAFMPAGQSTQIIIGASPERDLQILSSAQMMYSHYQLKRVYYSAYMPVNRDSRLPALNQPPPLLREHRLYQADWLLRFYHFDVGELLHGGLGLIHVRPLMTRSASSSSIYSAGYGLPIWLRYFPRPFFSASTR